jgi:aryl-alcohol dehydrogenase-like predicted oxidoreductase
MQYTRLGDSGLLVSRLSFGTVTFGTGMATVSKVDQEQAMAMIDRCLEAGINFFDTADAYSKGQSEEMLGRALGNRRHGVLISTKAGFRMGDAIAHAGLSRRHLIAAVEASLKRLGTDYIDVFHTHRTDPYTPLDETLEALDYLVRQGMVRYVGYSNWPAWMSAEAVATQRARGWARFVSAQMYYSLVARDVEHEIVPFLRSSGVGLMVWSPLSGGFLSGKYTRENLEDRENRLSGFDILPFDKERGFGLVERLREVGTNHGASPAQVAIAWLLAQPHVSTVLIGASKMHQLEDNLGAATLQLSAAETQALDELTRPVPLYPAWYAQNIGVDAAAKNALKAPAFAPREASPPS